MVETVLTSFSKDKEKTAKAIFAEKKFEIWLNLSNKTRSVFSIQISITYL